MRHKRAMKKTILSLALLAVLVPCARAQECTVSFDLNYGTSQTLSPVKVGKGRMLPADAKQYPEREGFRFGGWYTSAACRPDEEWRFGNNSSFYAPATDSMRVEKNMTLYAKWVAPRPVRTVEDLDAIREDLYGWYYLENDLDLSGIPNWTPIGEYEADYEYAPVEWWRHAFKGVLDGRGHTIRGLRITELLTDKSGLFGTVADGEISDLNLFDSQIILTADRPYVAPLAGILKQDKAASIRNCSVLGTVIRAKTTNQEATFHSFTGLCGGAWGGTLENNNVSGTMEIEIAGTGGGELYVGSYLGEAYNETRNCTSDFAISIHFAAPQPADGFKAYIGGLQASASFVDGCEARGRILLSGNCGSRQLFIGGLVGSERYGTLSGSRSSVAIEVLDSAFAQVGGIVGEFNATFGAMGAAFGVTTTRVEHCTYVGTPRFTGVETPVFGEISGAGQPDPLPAFWGPGMTYSIENCTYRPN